MKTLNRRQRESDPDRICGRIKIVARNRETEREGGERKTKSQLLAEDATISQYAVVYMQQITEFYARVWLSTFIAHSCILES